MAELREIVLDTETTGLEVKSEHKIIEIGCVELINKVKTGNVYHTYINPKREVSKSAYQVHKISNQFLQDKPIFPEIANDFVKYIGTSTLIIHNAIFDLQFLNHELLLLGFSKIDNSRVIDTLRLARKKFPGSPASLDALCKRFDISLKSRDSHGALIDSELLASVYIKLIGKKQNTIELNQTDNQNNNHARNKDNEYYFPKRSFTLSQAEKELHKKMVSKINSPLWATQDS